MKNHCAYCHGKFGLVRHQRAFKSFCSQRCVDQYKAWLRTEVGKRKGWSDCLWFASLSVVPHVETSPRAAEDSTPLFQRT